MSMFRQIAVGFALLATLAGSISASAGTSIGVKFTNDGSCQDGIAHFCTACAISFSNALARNVGGDGEIVFVWPVASHAPWAFSEAEDARILFPSMRIKHGSGVAFGFGECRVDAPNGKVLSAKVWFRSDAEQTKSVLPFSSGGIPKHLENIATEPPRLLGLFAETGDLAVVKFEYKEPRKWQSS
ncbi:hypothetical protein [Pseudaestuariivita sp.]|uniref:hypothetical protein n=1 Tax=Pseudaestuariivita sp. TaxID=2211669 RepID=UPI004059390E